MGWYAVEEVQEALEETKDLLLPFDWKTWARLIVLVVFTGSGISMPNFPTSSLGSDTGGQDFGSTSSGVDAPMKSSVSGLGGLSDVPITGAATANTSLGFVAIAAVAIVAGLIALLFLVASVFEFVYFQSLLDKNVRIRKNFSEHLGNGVRYFVFRVSALLVMGAIFVGSIALMISNPLMGILAVLAVIALLVPFLMFMGLTHNFVLLKMIESDKGLIGSWKEFYPDIGNEWREVAVYLLLRLALSIGASFLTLAGALLSLLVLMIPFAILGFLLSILAKWLVVVPVVLGVLAWILILLSIAVVTQTFMRYYAILVYHDLTV